MTTRPYRGPNPHLRPLWEQGWYHDAMGSVEVTPPPARPYRRLYHLLPAEYATSSLKWQRMKVARWSELNDRFELRPYAGHGTSMLQQMDGTHGLLCFSRDWTSGMLWSHYADKHAGIALGFDVHTKQLAVLDVTYSDSRLTGRFNLDTAVSTKAAEWRYEQEVRVIVTLQNMQAEGRLHFMPFGESLCLREVILGPECTQSLEATRKLVAPVRDDVVVIQARRADRFFTVVPDERTVPRWDRPSPSPP